MTLPLEDRRLLSRLLKEQAEIRKDASAGAFFAYPYGDRRRKPTSWIDRPTLRRWLKAGYVVEMSGAFRVAKNLPTRLAANDADDTSELGTAAQHRDMREAEIYNPQGSLRPTRINDRHSALDRIARQKDRSGKALLSPAQVEAGHLFARDYIRAGLGSVARSAYDSPKVDNARQIDSQERQAISRIDRQRRVEEAISCLGPGLDRALIAVCCENWSLDALERAEKWGRHAGLTVLRLALDRLVEFYGTDSARPPNHTV